MGHPSTAIRITCEHIRGGLPSGNGSAIPAEWPPQAPHPPESCLSHDRSGRRPDGPGVAPGRLAPDPCPVAPRGPRLRCPRGARMGGHAPPERPGQGVPARAPARRLGPATTTKVKCPTLPQGAAVFANVFQYVSHPSGRLGKTPYGAIQNPQAPSRLTSSDQCSGQRRRCRAPPADSGAHAFEHERPRPAPLPPRRPRVSRRRPTRRVKATGHWGGQASPKTRRHAAHCAKMRHRMKNS